MHTCSKQPIINCYIRIQVTEKPSKLTVRMYNIYKGIV